MASVFVDPKKTREFPTPADFYAWLAKNHDRETELWIKMHKKGSGLPSIAWNEAVDVCLCWGWIDGIRKSFDEKSFVQRYTPRGKKSIWSQINVDNVARLVAEGRMTKHGLAQVDAAKADGRWARAYAPIRSTTTPDDLLKAIESSPDALATYRALDKTNLFALAFRVGQTKTPEKRAEKIAAVVTMLAKGQAFHPIKVRAEAKAKAKATGEAKAERAKPAAKAVTKKAASAKTVPERA
jgi:uncharacterized protein YdeI (YjbR/CyaY-like superfamily)